VPARPLGRLPPEYASSVPPSTWALGVADTGRRPPDRDLHARRPADRHRLGKRCSRPASSPNRNSRSATCRGVTTNSKTPTSPPTAARSTESQPKQREDRRRQVSTLGSSQTRKRSSSSTISSRAATSQPHSTCRSSAARRPTTNDADCSRSFDETNATCWSSPVSATRDRPADGRSRDYRLRPRRLATAGDSASRSNDAAGRRRAGVRARDLRHA